MVKPHNIITRIHNLYPVHHKLSIHINRIIQSPFVIRFLYPQCRQVQNVHTYMYILTYLYRVNNMCEHYDFCQKQKAIP